ncbi:ficolin-2 [Aplysia californica]|uniref:Ficolin-2 n=1 Tax=Aplysia californica TaxID=6500 RepID=A0ABM1A799_APLCA|nr:ficolin-2 [Aplysia californica]
MIASLTNWHYVLLCLQRRASAAVDFFRVWADYKNEFGDLSGNFWLGLEKVHQLTNQAIAYCSHHQGIYELRIDMKYQGKDYNANYNKFLLYGESVNYRIQITGFSGNARDSMAHHNGRAFSTKDRDNDSISSTNCAKKYHGAWWYKSCHEVNLNGAWGSTESSKGLIWKGVSGYSNSVSFSEMKIRPFAK